MKTFYGTPQYEVYNEAVKLVGFDKIKELFLEQLDLNPNMPNNRKVGIKFAGDRLQGWPHSDDGVANFCFDGVLMGILNLKWEDMGLDKNGLSSLTKPEREAIMNGVMNVCKFVIGLELERLESILALNTTLPKGWDIEPA